MIRTLIVDDDALVRANLSSLLDWESCGYHIVTTASTGCRPWTTCACTTWTLLITDIKMPGIGGLQLLEQLRARRRGCRYRWCCRATTNSSWCGMPSAWGPTITC